MTQDNNINDLNTPIPLDEDAVKGTENWLNEHGEPDVAYLRSLAADGSQEALEKLKFIAEDLDVDYDPNGSIEELIDRIRAAVKVNESVDPEVTP